MINDNQSNTAEAFALLALIAAEFQTNLSIAGRFDAELVERVRRCVTRRQAYDRRFLC
jgi:hypothetical protein